VLKNCAGLAMFSVSRGAMFHGSLAAGSGVVMARRPDGSWTPPSAFFVHTIGLGLVFGMDFYECVCILNSPDQVANFTRARFSLGGDASVAVGPLGTGANVESSLQQASRPMWTYMKSRGFWAGIQVDGTVIITRTMANEEFYKEKGISVGKILSGSLAWPESGKHLFQVLNAIDGMGSMDASTVREVDMENLHLFGRGATEVEEGFVDLDDGLHENMADKKGVETLRI
jgi:SH3 domain-containing YSC84-like protein 1